MKYIVFKTEHIFYKNHIVLLWNSVRFSYALKNIYCAFKRIICGLEKYTMCIISGSESSIEHYFIHSVQ